jgi:predicted methyltransferase
VEINDNIGAEKKEEVVCEACNGEGYIEYAAFTLEEVKTILKHCGLSAES